MSARARKQLRARRRARERGVALIMVLGAIAVLTVLLAEFQSETSTELAAATADRDGVVAEYHARSAVNLARLLVAAEPTVKMALAPIFMMMRRTPPQIPVWEFSDKILGVFNKKEGDSDSLDDFGLDFEEAKNVGMEDGSFELAIVDEDAKINVNIASSNEIAHIRLAKQVMSLMAPPQYSPLFDKRDENGHSHTRMDVCRELIDWADVDEQAYSCELSQTAAGSSAGAEDAYYQLLPKPYRRKNAPYDSLEELRMVGGVSDDYWATFVDPKPEDPKKRVMTVWGQGKVNVNTANAQTLLGVICSGAPAADICTNPAQASIFLTGVTMARGMSMGAPMFGGAKDFINTLKGKGQLGPLLASVGMKPVQFLSEADFANSISTESKVFSIYAVGVKKGYKRETRIKIHAVVDFRFSPGLQQALGGGTGALAGGAVPGAAQASQVAVAGSQGAVDGAIPGFGQPSTGGEIIYFRIE